MARAPKYPERISVDERTLSYYLGLLAADGYLSPSSKCIQLNLQESDKATIVCFASSFTEVPLHIGYREPYTDRRGSSCKGVYVVSAVLPRLYDLCMQVGITPRKSKTLTVDFEQVPDKYCFLRGILDGDGNVNLNKRDSTSDCVRIASASSNFVRQLQREFGGRIYRQNDSLEVLLFNRRDCAYLIPRLLLEGTGAIQRKTDKLKLMYARLLHRVELKE